MRLRYLLILLPLAFIAGRQTVDTSDRGVVCKRYETVTLKKTVKKELPVLPLPKKRNVKLDKALLGAIPEKALRQ